jgi:hypothetical protein
MDESRQNPMVPSTGDGMCSPSGRRRILRFDLLCVVVVLVAMTLWIDFSHIHTNHNSDTFVMSLISIYRWTPLYWEQDRLGMLVPLLATPLKHPLANLLAQSGIEMFLGLAGFFLLGYYALGRRLGMTVGAVSVLAFLLAVRLRQQFGYLIFVHQFATSLTLSLLGLLALDHWRRSAGWWQPPLAVLLIGLALWVNPSLAFALIPLVLARRFFLENATAGERAGAAASADLRKPATRSWLPGRKGLLRLIVGYPAADWVALLATVAGLAISMAISKFYAVDHEPYAILGPGEWLACARGVLLNMPDELHGNYLAAISLLGLLGLVPLAWRAGRRAFGRSAWMAAGLLGPAAAQFAFMTSLNHVHRSDYGHYVFASVFLWQGACVAFFVSQWSVIVPDSEHARRLPYALLAMCFVLTPARHGRCGIDVVRQAIDEKAGKFSAEALDAQCTHVIGDYWRVWPTVFHANMRLADGDSPRVVWGITQRARPTMARWTRVPAAETRIAAILGDEGNSRAFSIHFQLPPMMEESRGQLIRVLRPTTTLAANWPISPYR